MYSLDLFVEVQRGDVGKVEAILDANPNYAHARGSTGSTLIHMAAQHGHIEMILFLHRRGCAGLKEPNAEGEYPIHIAARQGHVALLEVLHGMQDELCGSAEDIAQYDESTARVVRAFSILTYEELGCAPRQTILHSAALARKTNSIVAIHRLGSEEHFQEDEMKRAPAAIGGDLVRSLYFSRSLAEVLFFAKEQPVRRHY